MKNVLIILICLCIIMGCDKSDTNKKVSDNVVSETNTSKFKELLLILTIKNSDSTYIVADKIDSIRIKINDNYWGTYSSTICDTSGLNTFTENNLKVSKTKISYLVIADYDANYSTNNYTTAGNYSDYLNAIFEVKPGDYVCSLNEFRLINVNNQPIIIKPFIKKKFTVISGAISSVIEEIEISINNN